MRLKLEFRRFCYFARRLHLFSRWRAAAASYVYRGDVINILEVVWPISV